MELGGRAVRTGTCTAQVKVLPEDATKILQLAALFFFHFSLRERVIEAIFLELLEGHAEVGRISNHFKVKAHLWRLLIPFLTICEKVGWTVPISDWIVAHAHMGYAFPSAFLAEGLLLERGIR